MCMSMGRAPKSSPPGIDNRMWPQRVSSGPSTLIDARIRSTSSYGATGVRSPVSVSSRRSRVGRSMRTPIASSRSPMMPTSAMSGTLVISKVPSVSSVAAINLSTEFLAPGTATVPASGPLPLTTMVSSGDGALAAKSPGFGFMGSKYAPAVQAGGRTLIRRWPDTHDQLRRLSEPRDDLVLEAPASEDPADPSSPLHFVQDDGPFTAYERTVERREATDDQPAALEETTRYALRIPWFGWVFRVPVRRVIGLLAAASMSAAFVNTLFTQTVNFAADDFGVGDTGIGVAGAVVRAGILVALPAALIADRIGRRRVIVAVAWLGPLLSLLGALAPSFPVLVLSQTVARPMGIALAFLIGVVAAEEMPRNSRAYAVSVLAMASGFGAGIAVLSLRLADIGESGWRYVYLLAAIWCLVALDLSRRLPETRRFAAAHIDARRRPPRLNRKRLALLATVAFAGNIFVAPASFFQNRYLTDVHDFSGGMIGLFSIAVGTPAGIGLILGGRIADTSGRRRLIAVALPVSTAALVGAYSVGGPALWALSLLGGIVASSAYPALAVYRTELFPTNNRSRAAGLVTASALIGGIFGLVATGALLDGDWAYGWVMALMGVGQLVVTVLVVAFYPETAHRELESLNPEDIRIDLHHTPEPEPDS